MGLRTNDAERRSLTRIFCLINVRFTRLLSDQNRRESYMNPEHWSVELQADRVCESLTSPVYHCPHEKSPDVCGSPVSCRLITRS